MQECCDTSKVDFVVWRMAKNKVNLTIEVRNKEIGESYKMYIIGLTRGKRDAKNKQGIEKQSTS